MPLHDGTGPFGTGPHTDRRRGPCSNGYVFGTKFRPMFPPRGRSFPVIAVSVAVAAIRDLLNPSGLLRQIARQVLSCGKTGRWRTVTDAHYTILDEQPGPGASTPQRIRKENSNADT